MKIYLTGEEIYDIILEYRNNLYDQTQDKDLVNITRLMAFRECTNLDVLLDNVDEHNKNKEECK